jgi:HEAT repeat protein
MLKDSRISYFVHANIAIALGKLGGRAVAQDLMEILKNTQIGDSVRGVIAVTLGVLGEGSVVPDLEEMIKDRQIARSVGCSIAVALWRLGTGKQLAIPALVAALKDIQINDWLRSQIASALGNLAQDRQTMEICVLLLSHTRDDVADAIYSALWDMSRRAEVTIVVSDDEGGETVKFVPWQGGVRR